MKTDCNLFSTTVISSCSILFASQMKVHVTLIVLFSLFVKSNHLTWPDHLQDCKPVSQSVSQSVGSLSNADGNGNENVTWKYNFMFLLLLRDYSNSFNLYNVGKVSWNQIDRNGVQVRTENEKFTVVCSCSPQNLKFGHFMLLFSRGWQRNVQKHITHV